MTTVIKNVTIQSGYALKLSGIKENPKFTFTDGVNVLFGPNGCGKSTVINILAAYSSVPVGMGARGGWSKYLEPTIDQKPRFPNAYISQSPGKCKAKIEWNGLPTFLHSASLSDAPIQFFGEDGDGIMTDVDQIQTIFSKPSQGQSRIVKLLKLKDTLKNPPNLRTMPATDHMNSTWQKMFSAQHAYLKTLSGEGRMTILFDEPDRSLAIPLQIQFWTHYLPNLAKEFQIIIATHSFVPIFVNKFSIIDMQKGYVRESCEAIRSILSTTP